MANKEYLNVNELATLFGLNVQTLHYYDKIGILKPSYRDPKNGYRKYRFDQTYSIKCNYCHKTTLQSTSYKLPNCINILILFYFFTFLNCTFARNHLIPREYRK